MKKVLFATTALVAFAGAASADIAISGYAELGIVDADSVNATTGVVDAKDTSNTQLHTDVDVTFSMTGETDGGLSFGVSVDLDEAGKLGVTNTDSDYNMFLSGAFGTLTVGDTDGAMDFAMTEILGPGSLTDSETGHEGFKGSYLDGSYDGQIARFDYTAGDLSVAISTEMLDTDTVDRSNGYGLGVKYAMGNITFGAGYQKADSLSAAFGGAAGSAAVAGAYVNDDGANATVVTTGAVTATGSGFDAANDTVLIAGANPVTRSVADVKATGASVSGTFGAVTAGLAYTSYDSSVANFDATHTHLGVSYTQGAMTLGANIGNFDSKTNEQDRDGYAITANYSLGGGATLQAGYESSERNNVDNGGSWSLGLAMAF